jgi:hypothetical protein
LHEITTVAADRFFDTRRCHDAIAAHGATTIIPPRTNTKLRRPDTFGALSPNEMLRKSKRVGRSIRRSWSGNHH